jgi:thiamine biosynthesis lipoprotein ApbE
VIRWGSQVIGHVMDPASGRPADGRRQMTVVARTAIAADALSTAALVAGRAPGGSITGAT